MHFFPKSIFFISTILNLARCQETIDLSDSDQFAYSVQKHFEGMFSGTLFGRKQFLEEYTKLLDEKLKFNPCFQIPVDLKWYKNRLNAMTQTIDSCSVQSIKMESAEGLTATFLMRATFKAYTGRFSIYPIRFNIRKTDEASPYRIVEIDETISCYT